MANLLVLHGPNLNILGHRESEIYGDTTLVSINNRLHKSCQRHKLKIYQSNAEHELIDKVHQAMTDDVAGIVINPAAFTHTSIGLRDALLASKIPFIEVHLSNIFARESFRHKSYFSDVALGVISGFGADGYLAALNLLIQHVESI